MSGQTCLWYLHDNGAFPAVRWYYRSPAIWFVILWAGFRKGLHVPETSTEQLPVKAEQTNMQVTNEDTPPVVIEFKHVTKEYKLYANDRARVLGFFNKHIKYRAVRASDDLSFKIRKGESVALLGNNGAGKSTCLKMITGVTYPTSGEIEINGRVSALLELKAGFDNALTGRQNIYLRGQIWGLSNEEIAAREKGIVEFADLGVYIDQPMRSYSSGMKARLGFAFASSIDPDILIVDEALSVGDRKFKKKCRKRIKKIMNEEGTTVLFVTHSAGSARAFCERGMVLDHGKLMFDGPIDDAIAFYEKDDA